MLIKEDTVAARRVAATLERELGHSLSAQEKEQAVEAMQKHNPATAEGMKKIWGLQAQPR